MNDVWIRPAGMAAATVLIGGTLVAVVPQHAPTILRLVIATLAATAALHALGMNTPPRWWRSPFVRSRSRGRKARTADEIDWIRSMLAAPRQRIRNGPPLPPEALALLQPVIRAGLERRGLAQDGQTARSLLAPATRAVLDAVPLRRPGWYRLLPPDERATARTVQRVLDDVAGLTTSHTNDSPNAGAA
jgi:hypothetical protein